MYVDPQYRGRSINSGIIERLKQWCCKKGVTELRLEVYSDNLAAVGAYEKAGFSKHMIEMRLRLRDESPPESLAAATTPESQRQTARPK
jgi:ribosomal protein S18 acetylase RimI-like enzyme